MRLSHFKKAPKNLVGSKMKTQFCPMMSHNLGWKKTSTVKGFCKRLIVSGQVRVFFGVSGYSMLSKLTNLCPWQELSANLSFYHLSWINCQTKILAFSRFSTPGGQISRGRLYLGANFCGGQTISPSLEFS